MSALLKQNKIALLIILGGTIFVDGLFISRSSDIVYFGVLVAYVFFARMFRTKSTLTFLLCLGIFGVMSVSFLFTQASISTEKLVVWLVLFMMVGIVQGWRE